MEIEVSLSRSLFYEGFEMIVNGDLYTVQFVEVLDTEPERVVLYLKKEKM